MVNFSDCERDKQAVYGGSDQKRGIWCLFRAHEL